MMDFFHKQLLITGGIGGIGRAIALTMAKKGCKVFIFDIVDEGAARVEELNQELGEDLLVYYNVDLRDKESLKAQVNHLIQEHGDIDFLVNNAAIDTIGQIETMTDEIYEETQQINAKAAFLLCREILPSMRRLGGGAIVNVSSIILSGGWEGRVPYAMAKGSLLGLTRALAREVGKENIRVNAVSPGAIPTAMERKFWKDDRTELDQFILDRQSLKFRGSVDDIANAVEFLLSEKSRFITGHDLHVNGGWYMG